MSVNLKAVTVCFGYQQITSLSSATKLTVPQVTPFGTSMKPVFALIIPEGQAVRWRDDKTAPTASVGLPLAVGIPLQYDGNLQDIQFIEQVAGAKLNISYYA